MGGSLQALGRPLQSAPSLRDAENGCSLRFRFAQGFDVRPGKELLWQLYQEFLNLCHLLRMLESN